MQWRHSPSATSPGGATRNPGLDFSSAHVSAWRQSKMTVTLPGVRRSAARAPYYDEFTVALRDSAGRYRAWPTAKVKVQVDDPAEAHVDLLAKYTDDDIHNVMTYLLTLK